MATRKRNSIKRNTRSPRNTRKLKNSKTKVKKGGNNFGDASFSNSFNGSYYSLNTYKNDLFGMTKSSNLHGGKKR